MKSVGDALNDGFNWLVVHSDKSQADMHRLRAYPIDTDLRDLAELISKTQGGPLNGVSVTRDRADLAKPEINEERWLWGFRQGYFSA